MKAMLRSVADMDAHVTTPDDVTDEVIRRHDRGDSTESIVDWLITDIGADGTRVHRSAARAYVRREIERIGADRCEHCGAWYDDARNQLGYRNAGELCSAMIAAAGRHRATADAGDGSHIRIDDAIGVMARAKRAAWDAAHGPGRCVADESTFTGRVSLAAVLLGYPDTAAIMAGIPESIDDDEPNRTIWCALPVGDAPNPPSLASILLEQLAGDDGAADAFDELDSLRSAGGIPSAWG